MFKKSGFTLIELLIVIAIIAVLSVIGLVAYGNFMKNSRDAKRQSDLKIIQSALEDYHADQLYYPASLGSSLTSTGASGTKTYLNTVPTDPKPPPNYSYVPSPAGCSGSTCSGYCLSAKLEGTPPTPECTPASGYNYGVTRP